jgi:hypothetical protein
MDTKLPRLIGTCGYHPPLIGGTAHNDRLPLEGGIIPLLDRCVEGIHVDVNYFTSRFHSGLLSSLFLIFSSPARLNEFFI